MQVTWRGCNGKNYKCRELRCCSSPWHLTHGAHHAAGKLPYFCSIQTTWVQWSQVCFLIFLEHLFAGEKESPGWGYGFALHMNSGCSAPQGCVVLMEPGPGWRMAQGREHQQVQPCSYCQEQGLWSNPSPAISRFCLGSTWFAPKWRLV